MSNEAHEAVNAATAAFLRRLADLVENHQVHKIDFQRQTDYLWLLTNRHLDEEPLTETWVITAEIKRTASAT